MMCVLAWKLIMKASSKCISSAKSRASHSSILKKQASFKYVEEVGKIHVVEDLVHASRKVLNLKICVPECGCFCGLRRLLAADF